MHMGLPGTGRGQLIYNILQKVPLLYHTMGVLPSTQPVATLGSSFILSSFDMACACCVPFGWRC